MSEDLFWHVRHSPQGRTLVVFPYLGGFGSSLRTLVEGLTGDWDVWAANPPGHGPSREPALHSLDALVDRYVKGISMLPPGEVVLFGHSMGGVIAFHVARRLNERGDQTHPVASLVLSASAAPRDLPVAGYATLSNRALLDHLMSFGAFPKELARDPGLVEFFLPAFRADYAVLDEARCRAIDSLDVATTLVLGEKDAQTPAGTAEGWQAHIERPIRTYVLADAEHMFVNSPSAVIELDRILRAVADQVTLNELDTVDAWDPAHAGGLSLGDA